MASVNCIRVEVWDKYQCAGGTPLTHIADLLAGEVQRSTVNEQKVTLRVPRRSASASALTYGNIVVLQYDDGTSDEWRVLQRTADHGRDGSFLDITAVHPLMDLAEIPGTYLSQLSLGGVPQYQFGDVDLTPAQYITTYILGDANFAAVAPWISMGEVDPTIMLTLDFDHVMPLGFLQTLVTACNDARVPCELQLRKVSNTGYAIDILSMIGQGADTTTLFVGTHLTELQEQGDDTQRVTAVMALGADNATMRRAAWKATVISSTVLQLDDPAGGAGPMITDDQLVGCAVVRPDTGVSVAIAFGDAATQHVALTPDVSGFTTGDMVEIRADTSGDMLDTLTIPGERVKFGSVPDPTLRGDYNVIPNPFQDQWSNSSNPADLWYVDGDYSAVASGNRPTFSRVTTPTPLLGTYGYRIVTHGVPFNIATGSGVTGTPAYVTPLSPWINKTTDDSQLSFKMRVYPNTLGTTGGGVRTEVRIELWQYGVGTAIATIDTTPDFATGDWHELAVTNVGAWTSGRFYLRVMEKPIGNVNVAWDVVVGEAQLTQTPGNVDWLKWSAGNKLWTLANEHLSANGSPLIQYTAQQIDLARSDPDQFGYTVPVLGGYCHLVDDELEVDDVFRCIDMTTDLVDPSQTTTLVFAQQQRPLTKMLADSLLIRS